MAKESKNRNVPLALEFGYKLSLHATYFDAIEGKSIDPEHLPSTLRYVREELDVLNEYHAFFFETAIAGHCAIHTQEEIRDYLATLLRMTKARLHVRFGDPVEAAFELGGMFALNDLAPPSESIQERFLAVLRDLVERIGLKAKDELEPILSDLLAEEVEQRANARNGLFGRIESCFGERVSPSWFSGLEVATGIPGVVQVKKVWK